VLISEYIIYPIAVANTYTCGRVAVLLGIELVRADYALMSLRIAALNKVQAFQKYQISTAPGADILVSIT
jgi:hypothetical protein